jgi:CheY-like chemotaxis protein
MKELTAEFVRQEVARLGEIVVETAIYHPSGMKLFAAGDVLTLAHAKALHASGIRTLFLMEFEEDARHVRKSLGIERIAPKEAAIGDVVMDDLRGIGGDLAFPSGTTITSGNLDRLRTAAYPEVVIRHRRLVESMREAQEYFAQLAPPEAHGMSSTTRVTRVVHVPSTTARYLMIPRAHVLVAITDDPLRIFVSNALQSEGHHVVERPSPADAAEVAKAERNVTVIVLDLEESSRPLERLRMDTALRDAVVLVCAKEGQHGALQAALLAGANDWLPRPPSRDLLTEKIHGCQALLGRKVKLPPSLRMERRRQDRKPGGGECGLKDPGATKALPVVSGEILDQGEGGLRIDYNLPVWPVPWAYMVHGVHPRHFFYTYAYANPNGHDLMATIPGPRGSIERPVRIAQVAPSGEFEVLSLIFPEVKERLSTCTAVRKKF